MPRIEPLAPPHGPDVEKQLARMMPPGTPPIALFRTLAKNLPMARAMHGWGSYQLGRSLSLNLRDREIVINRTGCEYEWGVHVACSADRAHLDGPQIASLTFDDAGDPVWTVPRERLLIRAPPTSCTTPMTCPTGCGRSCAPSSSTASYSISSCCAGGIAPSATWHAPPASHRSRGRRPSRPC